MRATTLPATAAIATPRFPRPLVAWLGVNLLDAIFTYVLIGFGGIEGNPMLSHFQGLFGPIGMLAAKLALAAAVGLALTMNGRSHLLVFASRLMGLVAVYNAILLVYYFAPSMGMPFTF